MSKLVAFENLTLDGVMQAPGRPDEDPRGGFQHGGWAAPYADPVVGKMAAEGMTTTGALLLGRLTYEDFYGFWPEQTDNSFTPWLNNVNKYVASKTLKQPLPWINSTLLKGDVPQAVAQLKAEAETDILVMGSGLLMQTLMAHNLVDRYTLLIHPVVLGSGRRLFREGGPMIRLKLVDAQTTTTGVVVATYEAA
jgi:dihydrofolate reductase